MVEESIRVLSSLRGANGSRECAPDDRLRDEAIHSFFARRDGLLRFARNDGVASFRGGSQSRARNLEIPWDHPGMTTTRFVEVVPKRSPVLTIFWHCGFGHFSSRTGFGARARQQTVNGFGRGCGSKGSGNADSQRKLRSPGWSGQCRPRPGDSGCVPAHPAYRRAASYLPLRAGWAVCAWALRGCVEIARPFRAQTAAHH